MKKYFFNKKIKSLKQSFLWFLVDFFRIILGFFNYPLNLSKLDISIFISIDNIENCLNIFAT